MVGARVAVKGYACLGQVVFVGPHKNAEKVRVERRKARPRRFRNPPASPPERDPGPGACTPATRVIRVRQTPTHSGCRRQPRSVRHATPGSARRVAKPQTPNHCPSTFRCCALPAPQGERVLVNLDEPVGKNNGEIDGHTYCDKVRPTPPTPGAQKVGWVGWGCFLDICPHTNLLPSLVTRGTRGRRACA